MKTKKALWLTGILLAIVMLGLARWLDLEDRAWELIERNIASSDTRSNAIWLHDYEIELEAIEISCVDDNLSGITWKADSDQWFAVVNNPELLIEIDSTGRCLQTYPLTGLEDTEGVAWISDNRLVVIEERKYGLALITLPSAPSDNRIRISPLVTVGILDDRENMGLEGVAYNPEKNSILMAKEKSPIQIMEVTGVLESAVGSGLHINQLEKLTPEDLYMDDVSGLHFDRSKGRLLILSDESHMLVEMDLKGNRISSIDLEKNFHGLKDRIPQAEGVAMDNQGNLIVVSEPNLLYRYTRKPE